VKPGTAPGRLFAEPHFEEGVMGLIQYGKRTLAVGLAAVVLGIALPAAAEEYDPGHAGHPVRILAYVVSPIGVLFDYLVMRPAHWLGGLEPLATLLGRDE
jgi:uncharacterized membrane protein YhiD involved in acid resistance